MRKDEEGRGFTSIERISRCNARTIASRRKPSELRSATCRVRLRSSRAIASACAS